MLPSLLAAARFRHPEGVTLADHDRIAFVVDNFYCLVRQIVVATRAVTRVAGSSCGSADGIGTSARFYSPKGIAATPDGSILFVVDYSGRTLRKVVVATRQVTTIA